MPKTQIITLHGKYHITLYPTNQDLARMVRDHHLHYDHGMLLGDVTRSETKKTPLRSAVLSHNGIPVGVCIITKSNLIQAFIAKTHRRKGLGKQLVSTLINTLRTRSAHLHALDGYDPTQSSPFWESLHVMVEAHSGLELSNQEFDDVIQGKTTAEAIRTQRRLEYHLQRGWITQQEFEDNQRKWLKKNSHAIESGALVLSTWEGP